MQSQSVILNLARTVFIRGAAPFGANRAEGLLRLGLPAGLGKALKFLFRGTLEPDDLVVVERIEAMREAFATNQETFHVFTAEEKQEPRTAEQLAQSSSVTRFWGTFLYLCAKGFHADTVLELGSCIGISGSYLASAPECVEFVSIERSEDTSRVARVHIQSILPSAQVVNAPISDVLPDVLREFANGIALYYIDAFHRYEPTLQYFKTAIPFLGRGALVIFDDIHWSKEMWDAWLLLRSQPGFSHTVDVGRFGVGVWQGGSVQPQEYDLAKYVGWLRKYDPRR